jgi:hypothetical protein
LVRTLITRHEGAKEEVVQHQLALCEITIFELSAKGAKYVSQGRLPQERVARGIEAIVHDDSVVKTSAYEGQTLTMAIKLRSMVKDFIDCLIIASAARHCDVLTTEDDEIHSLSGNRRFEEVTMRGRSSKPLEIRRLREIKGFI